MTTFSLPTAWVRACGNLLNFGGIHTSRQKAEDACWCVNCFVFPMSVDVPRNSAVVVPEVIFPFRDADQQGSDMLDDLFREDPHA